MFFLSVFKFVSLMTIGVFHSNTDPDVFELNLEITHLQENFWEQHLPCCLSICEGILIPISLSKDCCSYVGELTRLSKKISQDNMYGLRLEYRIPYEFLDKSGHYTINIAVDEKGDGNMKVLYFVFVNYHASKMGKLRYEAIKIEPTDDFCVILYANHALPFLINRNVKDEGIEKLISELLNIYQVSQEDFEAMVLHDKFSLIFSYMKYLRREKNNSYTTSNTDDDLIKEPKENVANTFTRPDIICSSLENTDKTNNPLQQASKKTDDQTSLVKDKSTKANDNLTNINNNLTNIDNKNNDNLTNIDNDNLTNIDNGNNNNNNRALYGLLIVAGILAIIALVYVFMKALN